MPKGYVIFTENIQDQEGMQAYGQVAGPTLGDASVLVVDQDPEVLEGEWHGNQTVILEFDSVEAARAWYESTEYSNAKLLRQAAAECNAVIVSGYERRAG